jgi:aquaporin Z
MKKYLAEMVGKMVLVLMGCGVAVSLNCSSNCADVTANASTVIGTAMAFGLSLILVHLVCIRYTGTSVNPARSFGPALFQGGEALTNLWIFIVGPFIGGACAAGIWKVIEPAEKD